MLKLLIAFSLLFSICAFAKTPVGVFYFTEAFGHVHANASRYSSSLTTIACGHPLKVYAEKNSFGKVWYQVEVGGQKGYILKEFLSHNRNHCFQTNYPVFFNAMNLGVTELYYWGRLYDQYIKGEVRLK